MNGSQLWREEVPNWTGKKSTPLVRNAVRSDALAKEQTRAHLALSLWILKED
jgi:hypothetical protein